jgi:hypothetical protein
MFKENSTSPQSSPKQKRASTGSITVSTHTHVDQIIVHPGAVLKHLFTCNLFLLHHKICENI